MVNDEVQNGKGNVLGIGSELRKEVETSIIITEIVTLRTDYGSSWISSSVGKEENNQEIVHVSKELDEDYDKVETNGYTTYLTLCKDWIVETSKLGTSVNVTVNCKKDLVNV